MRIELDRLKELGGRFAQVYGPEDLALEDSDVRLVGPAEVSGSIERIGPQVELKGRVKATVDVLCGRCLKPVELPLDARFSERFTPAVSWRAEAQHELSEEDLNISVFDGEAINVDEIVREEILLAIPAHVLCREGCPGLCPSCGVDRNVTVCECQTDEADSPWAKLKSLQP